MDDIDLKISQELARIYKYLSEPEELDIDSLRILRENLWKLYE